MLHHCSLCTLFYSSYSKNFDGVDTPEIFLYLGYNGEADPKTFKILRMNETETNCELSEDGNDHVKGARYAILRRKVNGMFDTCV
jgi:hypothetical protein